MQNHRARVVLAGFALLLISLGIVLGIMARSSTQPGAQAFSETRSAFDRTATYYATVLDPYWVSPAPSVTPDFHFSCMMGNSSACRAVEWDSFRRTATAYARAAPYPVQTATPDP